MPASSSGPIRRPGGARSGSFRYLQYEAGAALTIAWQSSALREFSGGRRTSGVEIRHECRSKGHDPDPAAGASSREGGQLTPLGACGRIGPSMLETDIVRRAVRTALEEDLGPGDITSRRVLDAVTTARGIVVAREPIVVAGLPVAKEVFLQVDSTLVFESRGQDGEECAAGARVATVRGSARAILAAERTALNFLQRMSGIATATRRAVALAGAARVQISETRKTAPGLRALDRYAVRTGGGTNHRAGLFDAILVKDNHWRLAGGVGAAVRRARLGRGSDDRGSGPVEVEATTVEEMDEAIQAGADAVLLDNMVRPTLQRAVSVGRGRVFLEVSGGVREEDIPFLASLGVDRISLGFLTHSVRAADLALEVEPG